MKCQNDKFNKSMIYNKSLKYQKENSAEYIYNSNKHYRKFKLSIYNCNNNNKNLVLGRYSLYETLLKAMSKTRTLLNFTEVNRTFFNL